MENVISFIDKEILISFSFLSYIQSSKVAVERTLIEAPQLLMSCRISLQEDRLGSKKEVSAVLSVQISELKSGENVMRTSVVWGAEKRRSFLGL